MTEFTKEELEDIRNCIDVYHNGIESQNNFYQSLLDKVQDMLDDHPESPRLSLEDFIKASIKDYEYELKKLPPETKKGRLIEEGTLRAFHAIKAWLRYYKENH